MKKILIGASIFVGIILLLISPFACMAYKFKQATKTQTDPQKFEAILTKRNEGGYKPHFFPKQLGESAEQVAFYYTPGFLQGGTTMVLRMKFPEAELIPLNGSTVRHGSSYCMYFITCKSSCSPDSAIPRSIL
jgi:hypothetical protein